MHVLVNGVRLFFDVEGAGLVPDGPTLREKPTLVLLHGGPGFDHSIYKPRFSALADIAQVVFLDHRGNGRSDPGPRESWTLAQWGDDVRAFCETLGIAHPIVLGVSFGGMVALAYATRHPAHPAKLILVSTEAAGGSYRERRVAMFERFGGPEVGALARRRFLEGHTDAATLEAWVRLAFPLYTRTPRDPAVAQRTIRRPEVTQWFTKPGGEGHTFDFFPALSRVQCPTLVLGGEEDPMTPIECQRDLVAALPSHLARFERFAGCGHGVLPDAPERAMAVIRHFIAGVLIVLAVVVAGCAGAGLTPSASVTTAVQGWDRYFRLDWTGQATPDGVEIDGYIYNTYGSPAANVRVLAQALDATNDVIAQRIEWVPGIVPNFSRSYFRIPSLPSAAQYRVTVWSFDIVDTDTPGFWRRRF